MPQELHVVKCYKCQTFQVQIVKKINKFECKMCGEKQSVKKVYYRGAGKDCRLHVQRLNELRLQNQDEFKIIESNESSECLDKLEYTDNDSAEVQTQGASKWLEYLEVPKEEPQTDDENDPPALNFNFKRPNKKKLSACIRNKKLYSDKKKCVEVESKQKPNGNNTSIEVSAVISTPASDTKCLNKASSVTNMSKWVDFVTIEKSQNDSLIDVQVHSTEILKNIFKTDDANLDDILNF